MQKFISGMLDTKFIGTIRCGQHYKWELSEYLRELWQDTAQHEMFDFNASHIEARSLGRCDTNIQNNDQSSGTPSGQREISGVPRGPPSYRGQQERPHHFHVPQPFWNNTMTAEQRTHFLTLWDYDTSKAYYMSLLEGNSPSEQGTCSDRPANSEGANHGSEKQSSR